jgi:hypothetical protein
MALALGDGRHGDKQAQAKNDSASPNCYCLSIHYFFSAAFVAIATLAAVCG